MNNLNHFIIIDDDPINNKICSIIIKMAVKEADIQVYTSPEKGLEYINSEEDRKMAILFLDINMPTMTGWEVLQSFEKFSEKIKSQYKIFILSSSVDEKDKERARQNPFVAGYLEKPLSSEMVLSCLKKTAPKKFSRNDLSFQES